MPGKNIIALGDKPLLAWSIEPALQAELIDRVVVCTDDEEIARVARDHGAEIPFMRDKALGEDHIGCNEVMIWTVKKLFKIGYLDNRRDIVVYLQATDLFKKATWLDECVQVLRDNPDIDLTCFCSSHRFKFLVLKNAE